MASIIFGAFALYVPTPKPKEPAMALPVCVCGHIHDMVLKGTLGDPNDKPCVGPQDSCLAILGDVERCQCRAYCPSGPIHSERGTANQAASQAAHAAAFGDFVDKLLVDIPEPTEPNLWHGEDPEC